MNRDTISHELHHVYITSDGKKFLIYKEALKHQENLRRMNNFQNKRVSSNTKI